MPESSNAPAEQSVLNCLRRAATGSTGHFSAIPYLLGGLAAIALGACSQSDGPGQAATSSGGTVGGDSGGATLAGGKHSASGGNASSSGGAAASGGWLGSGGANANAGTVSTSGAPASGGATGFGGATSGGAPTAGSNATSGGKASSGGGNNSGGSVTSGGKASSGGSGGASSSGGSVTSGGKASSGGASNSGGTANAAGAAGTPSQTCPPSQSAPSAGNRRVTLQQGGQSRSYILHVPPGLTAGKPLPVVLDFHGASGSGSQQQGMSGWDAVADREGFLTVYPDGTSGYWNVDDKCCGAAGTNKVDDVGFVKAIITKLNTDACIDSRRIYASGFSNGGGLAHRLGCDAADVIAAIAPVATDLRTQPCKAARAISMIEFRGTADSLEPYEGGIVGPVGGQYNSPGAKGSLKLWADINQCTGTPKTSDKYCETYTECSDSVETALCSLPNVDHNAYGNSLNFKIADVAWAMFRRQPMK